MLSRTRVALPERLPPWGVAILESHHADDFSMEWRTHPFLKLVYVLAGEGVLCLGDLEQSFAPRDLLVIPAGVRNRIVDTPGRPSSLYVLCIARRLIRFEPRCEASLGLGRRPRSALLANRAETRLRRLRFHHTHGADEASVPMVAEALGLLHLVAVASRDARSQNTNGPGGQKSTSASDMARYIAYLDEHFFEAEGVDAAAKQLGISRRAFTQRFRQHTGESWLRYTRLKAIDYAARLLRETEVPVTAIAFECGFGDLSTFYRQFKARLGMPPAAYRATLTGKPAADQ
ncbi:AraC family transcriptional regulator [Botrimarina hoheduenensis]|uniref:HTH-type transcriptional activator RhaS n=1 Tax=Botrimarina hoheduenensis TaxID=2528000 RepID=A0A5C5VSP2_9BACT|nr:AraC family transcriptional regulator [Botrimarina hoheduenensis]TWT40761.1 HTH-type transcriptional activator RhaS [Botrimarina hoheduenensis]